MSLAVLGLQVTSRSDQTWRLDCVVPSVGEEGPTSTSGDELPDSARLRPAEMGANPDIKGRDRSGNSWPETTFLPNRIESGALRENPLSAGPGRGRH